MGIEDSPGEPPRLLLAQQVAVSLRRQLRDDGWDVGDKLPNERLLAQEHGVGVNTARRALRALEREGVLRRSQGSGTFVQSIPVDANPRRGRSLMGVVLPAEKYYTGGVIEGISAASIAAGYRLLISYSSFEPDLELQCCGELLSLGARGLIMSPSFYNSRHPQQHLRRLQQLKVPVVLVSRRPPGRDGTPMSYVTTDFECGARLVVERLTASGRQRIGYFGTRGAQSDEVRRAFGRELELQGLPVLAGVIVERTPWTPEEIRAYVAACKRDRVDAVLCMDDRKALLLQPALLAAGIAVPDDIEVVAYDDAVAESTLTSLTTITPPDYDVGRISGELLAMMIASGSSAVTCHVEVQPRLTHWSPDEDTIPPAS